VGKYDEHGKNFIMVSEASHITGDRNSTLYEKSDKFIIVILVFRESSTGTQTEYPRKFREYTVTFESAPLELSRKFSEFS
jgi:hypothetical protein